MRASFTVFAQHFPKLVQTSTGRSLGSEVLQHIALVYSEDINFRGRFFFPFKTYLNCILSVA